MRKYEEYDKLIICLKYRYYYFNVCSAFLGIIDCYYQKKKKKLMFCHWGGGKEFFCPSCAAPISGTDLQTCSSCGQQAQSLKVIEHQVANPCPTSDEDACISDQLHFFFCFFFFIFIFIFFFLLFFTKCFFFSFGEFFQPPEKIKKNKRKQRLLLVKSELYPPQDYANGEETKIESSSSPPSPAAAPSSLYEFSPSGLSSSYLPAPDLGFAGPCEKQTDGVDNLWVASHTRWSQLRFLGGWIPLIIVAWHFQSSKLGLVFIFLAVICSSTVYKRVKKKKPIYLFIFLQNSFFQDTIAHTLIAILLSFLFFFVFFC